MKSRLAFVSLTTALTLSACGGKEVSFDTLETQRAVANDNSKFNATKWRAENGFEGLNILARGDSSQQANCPMGDGWATIDLIDPKTKQTQLKLKCSTVSAQVGCWKEEDFKARSQLASQDGTCNKTLPETLKKIEQ